MTAKTKNKGLNFLTGLTLALHVIAVIGLFGSYAAYYISPAQYWIFAFFGLAYPFLLLLNLFFVMIWLLFWKRYIWLSILVIGLGYSHLYAIIQYRWAASETRPAGSMKILTS